MNIDRTKLICIALSPTFSDAGEVGGKLRRRQQRDVDASLFLLKLTFSPTFDSFLVLCSFQMFFPSNPSHLNDRESQKQSF